MSVVVQHSQEFGSGGPVFSHSVLIGEPTEYDLLCKCGQRYHIVVQSDHFHVHEMGKADATIDRRPAEGSGFGPALRATKAQAKAS